MDNQKPNSQSYLTPIAIIVAGIVVAGAIVVKDQIQIKFSDNKPTVAGEQTTTPPTTGPDLSALSPTSANAVLGDKDAKISLTVFSDFACPYCAAAAGQDPEVMKSLKTSFAGWEPAIPNIIKDYVDTGKVKLIFREYPLHGPAASKAAEAAMCANEKGKYLALGDKMFSTFNTWSKDADPTEKILGYAKELGIDIADCLKSGKHTANVERDLADGKKLQVNGTPTFFLNNQAIVGAQPYSEFKKAIDALL